MRKRFSTLSNTSSSLNWNIARWVRSILSRRRSPVRQRETLSTAPVPYPTTFLQIAEAVAAGEDLHWNQRQRTARADMEGSDRHADSQIPADEIVVQLAAVQSRGAAAATLARIHDGQLALDLA